MLIAAYLLTGTVGVEVWQKPLLFGYYITDVLVILLIGKCPDLCKSVLLFNYFDLIFSYFPLFFWFYFFKCWLVQKYMNRDD